MKKSVVVLLLTVLMALVVDARSLTEDQQNIAKIQTAVCPVGQTRCLVKAFQECDGSTFVTKKVCSLQEVCDVGKGCVPRAEKIMPAQRGISKDFNYWRYHECRRGEIKCNKRFIRTCENNRWVDSTCAENEYCHPAKGCVAKAGMTRFKERELGIPKVPKVPFVRQY